eukprot:TRINITY_DN18076_c0_g2_i1.p1 TRINITY_DN18076_c0_g2~~TRINITY_DN18076_c0_g2_i1.p1  ORF type:complete len:852 (+),score=197.95 TRINITY_DN18076_c0_g2_i1:117-2558(+)
MEKQEAEKDSSSSSSSEESDDDDGDDDDYYDSDDSSAAYSYESESDGEGEYDNSPAANIKRFTEVLESKQYRKRVDAEDRDYVFYEDLFDFPKDRENWREEDLKELWADAPMETAKPGWDPAWADVDDCEMVREQIKAGKDPAIAPFYLPYRKYYPAIPDNHYDISNPKSVIEELDRIEEFLKWVSYVFPDGSSYEGTVWDDLAHGKGVYVAKRGLVRYEGEWLQNNMEGHGVIEVDIPDIEPIPGSKLEAKMREKGRIISRDFMSPEDKKWLEMDIEDSVRLVGNKYVTPFYENDEWIRLFGQKPEKGRYRYSGQWKHGRMHGCGVYEVNERILYGRFYFGELLDDSTGCDDDASALHAGIAEVAAAKAQMFVNKPDGMVREERGPYSDPQHPYLYEEDDVWMAPGFVNQFYEVPDYWKRYVGEVDQEREMWLNSFYKAPLRIPMPAELEYWWSKDEDPEFVLINKEPEPDPEDPSKLIYTEDPLILHTRTGRLINYVEDEKDGVRLFWQPPLKDGEEVNPEKAEFLPLGFDEFYGKAVRGQKKESKLKRLITALETACQPVFDRVAKWSEEKKKASEMKLKLIEKEMEFIEAELCLEEVMEDMEMELKMKQKEEEKKAMVDERDKDDTFASTGQDADSDDDEEEDEEEAPTSFGSVLGDKADQNSSKDDEKRNKPGNSPFASSSMLFACSLTSLVPLKLEESFLSWKNGTWLLATKLSHSCHTSSVNSMEEKVNSAHFPRLLNRHASLKAAQEFPTIHKRNKYSQLHSLAQIVMDRQSSERPKTNPIKWKLEGDWYNILSMHALISSLESS